MLVVILGKSGIFVYNAYHLIVGLFYFNWLLCWLQNAACFLMHFSLYVKMKANQDNFGKEKKEVFRDNCSIIQFYADLMSMIGHKESLLSRSHSPFHHCLSQLMEYNKHDSALKALLQTCISYLRQDKGVKMSP